MQPTTTTLRAATAALLLAGAAGAPAWADGHGIALYGEPEMEPGFAHLPHVNPDAPKGGAFSDGQVGSFDSLNPHIQKGRVPWQLRFLAYETLMHRSYGEPFTNYALLAESVEVSEDETQVTYTLDADARFSDGTPVTPQDVIWSFNILGQEGAHGRYRGAFNRVTALEQVGERGVRFTIDSPDRELLMILGMRPVMKAAQWEGREEAFFESGLDEVPITSAPYVITDVDAGRFVELSRNEGYWGADLPVRVGTNNVDTIRMEFFGDATAHFEAFKAGELSTFRETNAAKWNRDYDFPAVQSGDVVLSEIPHQRPTGMTGLVMNTRRAPFDDWRVRQAMIEAYNFEYMNAVLNDGALPRITSYFANSPLGMQDGPAEGRVAELLAPYADDLLPGTLEGYALPETNGEVANRGGLRRATALLEEAGYVIGDDGALRGPDGAVVTFEIMLPQGSSEVASIVDIYTEALKRLGIEPTVTSIDSAQFKERTTAFDFDMTWNVWGVSLSPGNEQLAYWGSEAAGQEGSRNWMGATDPAIDGMVEAMLSADTQEDYVAAVRALDRVLTAGRYVIPTSHNPISYLAHADELQYPETLPIYGDWIGFQPDVWWMTE
ncbi:ABC transporter substrate-binding protein [Jannaschia sp. Os4]|uniref:extracellular solute-binding protein n=1 Tax=Jannaschia sp. Os4 TaxID=2807617 RepID=UPI001939421D|nr:extracellular solute-binding protein [Jannaschia sp. Os4]MBM2577068.1 ABC transporter substrate-binding protein [Jannaschia sp. Os4]